MSPRGRLHEDRMASRFSGAIGSHVRAALQSGSSSRIEDRKSAHLCRLREKSIAQAHQEALVERGPAELKIGRRISGMSRDADQSPASGLEPPFELESEKQVGELGLSVGAPSRVPAFALQVVEPHLPAPVVLAADGHNTSVWPFVQERQQEAGQREMPEMIGPELELKAIDRPLVRRSHHSGVVDQQVDLVVAGSDAVRERSYRAEVGKVQPCSLHVGRWKCSCDGPCRFRALRTVTTGEDHLRAMPGQLSRHDATKADVGARDNGCACALIGDFLGGPLLGHRRSYLAPLTPPSMTRPEAITNFDTAAGRKGAAPATSSGRPRSLLSWLLRIDAIPSSGSAYDSLR